MNRQEKVHAYQKQLFVTGWNKRHLHNALGKGLTRDLEPTVVLLLQSDQYNNSEVVQIDPEMKLTELLEKIKNVQLLHYIPTLKDHGIFNIVKFREDVECVKDLFKNENDVYELNVYLVRV